MKPITRETIVDRRQPQIRWSAIFAGAAVSVGLWILLQLIGMGAGLAAIDTNHAGNLRSIGIGTTVWSLVVPLFAMFAGSIIAGRLAATRDHRVGSMHGLVMWAITSVLGVLATVWMVSALARGADRLGAFDEPTSTTAAGHVVTTTSDAREQRALEAAEDTGKALLWGGLTLMIALFASVGGGAIGVKRGDHVDHARNTAPYSVPPPPGAVTLVD